MKLKPLLTELITKSAEDVLKSLSNIENYGDFQKQIVALPNDTKQGIVDYISQLNNKESCTTGKLLYHGTNSKIGLDILNNGFKIGKGRRSGFMGSENIIDNLGIFLTDSQKAASFFGNNRSERGDFVVIKACASLKSTLDLSIPNVLPIELKKLGLNLVNGYNGSTKTKLAGKDIWWLLDRTDFVNKIKELGYDSVKFKEASDVVKMIDDPSAHTYMVFDTLKLKISKRINNLQDLHSYLRGDL